MMKNTIYGLTILLFFSCETDFVTYGDTVRGKGIYTVDIYTTIDMSEAEDFIIAKDGYTAKLGTTLTFEAIDIPGWKFISWSKRKECYGCYQPLIDDENSNIAYVYMHEKYHGNSNIGPENVQIVANYIKTLE